MIKVIDNFLDPNLFKSIQSYLMSSDFPWYWNPYVASYNEEIHNLKNPLNNFQFTHTFYQYNEPCSDGYKLIKHVIERLDAKSLIAAKCNLLPRLNEIEEHGYHTDFDFPCNTGVLYINTCNGYTKFESTGEKVYSVENRFVMFPSHVSHTGSSCTDQKSRLVLNINWI